MPRPVRYHESFRRDLTDRVHWLRRNRSAGQIRALRVALQVLRERVARYPAAAEEVDRRGTLSFRVRPIGGRLPYVVWYYYDSADRRAPVWLAMLLHEMQDRERFDPDRFE